MLGIGALRQELWHFAPNLGIIFTMSQSLWNFSLAAYANKAVQDECLALQDKFGLDVNLILLCSYLGAVHGVTLTAEETASARDVVRQWHDDIVRPLRVARRSLKPIEGQDAQRLRAQVKAAELESERIEQTMLQQWADARLAQWRRGEARAAVPTNLQALLAASGIERLTAETAMPHTISGALSAAQSR